MGSKPFIRKILTKLEKKIPSSLNSELKSRYLNHFFSENDLKLLPNIIAKSIYNTFSDLDLSIVTKGMNSIDKNAQNINNKDYEDLSFLELHRKNSLLTKSFRKREKISKNFFHHIDSKKDSQCLIPNKLYFRTLKNGKNTKKLNHSQKNIKVNYIFKDIKGKVLAGNYKFENSSSDMTISKLIPGLAHGLLGMKEGEIRKIYIHPDFVYGPNPEFAQGLPIVAKVKLVSFGEISEMNDFPQIKPVNMNSEGPDILSCSEFLNLQNKYTYYCGLKIWSHYKKSASLCSFEKVLKSLNEIIEGKKTTFSNEEKKILLKLEWLLYQN